MQFYWKKPLFQYLISLTRRWHSKYDMLERLLELKEFCVNYASTDKQVELSENDWASVQQLKEALEPAKEATKVLQYEQLVAGDF